ncbi:MAG TPA: FHA domain-containing protein [Microthrixaceae bacterium]|nr:FHA domain-containing protein [Microthrixaceae bacterium]
MPEQLLTVLKLCLLALLYLFFLRVLRAVWTEVNPPKAVATPPAPPTGTGSARSRRSAARSTARARRKEVVPTRLVVVEPGARAGVEYALGPDMTVGRAQGCNLVFDEQYVSQVHTRIFSRDGSVFVEDLGSTNGTWVNGSRAVGQMPARLGDRIQIGNVVMEVR